MSSVSYRGSIIRGIAEPPQLIQSGRTRSAAGERLPLFLPDLAPSYQVSVSRSAQESIRRELRTVELEFGAVETGGWLLSDSRWPDRILLATDPGDGARLSRSSVELNPDRFEELQHRYPHLTLRGDYHLHPSGDAIPSMTDRKAWHRGREMVGDYYVGLIVAPRRTMWEEPELHGWLTTDSFCERLRVKRL